MAAETRSPLRYLQFAGLMPQFRPLCGEMLQKSVIHTCMYKCHGNHSRKCQPIKDICHVNRKADQSKELEIGINFRTSSVLSGCLYMLYLATTNSPRTLADIEHSNEHLIGINLVVVVGGQSDYLLFLYIGISSLGHLPNFFRGWP